VVIDGSDELPEMCIGDKISVVRKRVPVKLGSEGELEVVFMYVLLESLNS